MAAISASLVKDLREKTGAGMMDCKNALTEVAGDIEAAVDWLRKKGLSKAARKSGRVAAEGLVAVAVRGHEGVVIEVNCETDFVARNEDFQKLVRSIVTVAAEKGVAAQGKEDSHSFRIAAADPFPIGRKPQFWMRGSAATGAPDRLPPGGAYGERG